ncbi:hypothetical protein [Saccharomonospora azurea]|uniref:hypothetical protein n=1 Tax=Saccharomonospora azurea TaxID=40988 RepID=UPI0024098C04|nr:hypothetical protein [Saccharomonospora azurea]
MQHRSGGAVSLNSLITDFVEQEPGTPTPDGRDLGDRSWSRVRFDIVLAAETV